MCMKLNNPTRKTGARDSPNIVTSGMMIFRRKSVQSGSATAYRIARDLGGMRYLSGQFVGGWEMIQKCGKIVVSFRKRRVARENWTKGVAYLNMSSGGDMVVRKGASIPSV